MATKKPSKKTGKGLTPLKITLLIFLIAAAFSAVFLRHSADDVSVQSVDNTPAESAAAVPSPSELPSPEPTAAPTPEAVPVTPTPQPGIQLGEDFIPLDTEELKVDEVDFEELYSAVTELTELRTVDAYGCTLTDEEKIKLVSARSDVSFLWNVEIDGISFDSAEKELEIPSPDKVEVFAAKAQLLPDVETVTLAGGDYTPEQAAVIAKAYTNADVKGTITLFEQTFSNDAEELDFSGTPITVEETAVFDDLIAAMPNLKKVIMSDCGLTDEEMDTLDLSHDDVRFVWTVHFKVYSVRTDADRFCVSDLPWNDYVCWPMSDKDFAPIKYCRDLVALDLGHENVSDLSFLYNMPKLRYLILAIAHNTLDLTPISSLHELYYLEIFHNEIIDLSPLLECTSLRHLNIGNCSGNFSIEPLYQMTWLDRLWFPLNHLSEEEKESLTASLPDTDVYLGSDDEVGGGWRDSEVYEEMHAAMFTENGY